MIILKRVNKKDENLTALMKIHYSAPKGFVGRSICYLIYYDEILYGAIVAGSCTLHLPNRNSIIPNDIDRNCIVNNVFYHIEKSNNQYPIRNFTQRVLFEFEKRVITDWLCKYGDKVLAFESLVELPRTGEIYKRCGYNEVGITKGFTCKRISGESTDKWSGRRVWDYKNLRPKRVFCKLLKEIT